MSLQSVVSVKEIAGGTSFIEVKDNRFKTNLISLFLVMPMEEGTVSANALLPFLLKRCCRDYPDLSALNRRLAELYGARLSGDVSTIGENQMLSLSITAIDDRFALNQEVISGDCARLICSLLFDPALENGTFQESDIALERRCLTELIDSEINEKRVYAKNRLREIMFRNERYGIGRYGTRDGALTLTPGDVTAAWNRVLACGKITMLALGSADTAPALSQFTAAIGKLNRTFSNVCATEFIPSADSVNYYTERLTVNQAKLVMGFRAGAAQGHGNVYAVRVMTALFGGMPHSKLFLNVREKKSLCYYCVSRYDRQKGVVFVECGIEEKNYQAALDEILVQLDCIRRGEFDENELNATILAMKNQFEGVTDSQMGTALWYADQLTDEEMLTPADAAKKAAQITRDDVIAAAKAATLDTVYLLAGEEE